MKKVVLVTFISLLGFAKMNVQSIEFGVKGGLNFANISGDNVGKAETVTSFNFGAMAEISISDKFSFQPEVLYSGQGYAIGKDITALSYLNVPLMAKYYATKIFSIEAGPQIGFLLAAKTEDIDVKDNFKNIDFGVNMGIGYKLDNGLNFGARYNVGLSDINNQDLINDKIKNGTLQVSVGYFF